jgi:hypothetical protein
LTFKLLEHIGDGFGNGFSNGFVDSVMNQPIRSVVDSVIDSTIRSVVDSSNAFSSGFSNGLTMNSVMRSICPLKLRHFFQADSNPERNKIPRQIMLKVSRKPVSFAWLRLVETRYSGQHRLTDRLAFVCVWMDRCLQDHFMFVSTAIHQSRTNWTSPRKEDMSHEIQQGVY